jgi:uncharacterized protein (DUF1684 family)
MRFVISFLVILALLGATVDKFDPATHKKEVEEWRANRIQRLKSEDGWLTLVGLFWLQEGDNSFGSDPTNKIVFPKDQAPAKAGSLHMEKGTVHLQVEPGVTITSDGKPVTSMLLKSDADGEPTTLNLGSLRFFVIDRMGKLGIRLKDKENPLRKSFQGVDSYPIDAKWRIEAKFEPYKPEKKIPILNILNMLEDTPSPGALVFDVNGKTYRLDAVLEKGETDYFIIFGDQTNGKETYGAGRYVYASPPGADGKVILDFNKAYNPPCVFSHFATCPLPPPQNKLAVRIEAGEKKFVAPEHH